MIILLYVFVFCVLLGIITYIWSYAKLFVERKNVYSKYFSMTNKLNSRYGIISEYIKGVQNTLSNDKSLIDYLLKLQTNIMTLGNNVKEIDRRIALDTELDIQMQKLFSIVNDYPILQNNSELCDLKENYYNNRQDIVKSAYAYNRASKQLLQSVSVFPTSFIARLNCIKSTDTVMLN